MTASPLKADILLRRGDVNAVPFPDQRARRSYRDEDGSFSPDLTESVLPLAAGPCQGVADDLRIDGGTVQKQLAQIYVMSLLHTHMLRRDVKVAHSPLQRRAFIKRSAAACSKASIDDT